VITPVSNKADILNTMPRKGGEPDDATNKRPAEARKQPDPQGALSGPIDRESLERAVVTVSEALHLGDTRTRLEIDQDAGQAVVKVLKESGEVIRQFPPEELLKLAKYLSDRETLPSGKGFLVKELV
jgi:flagellar protein FlaG